MSTEENKRIASRIPLELAKGNLGVLNETYSPNEVEHNLPPGVPNNLDGVKQVFGMIRQAFPDFSYKVEDTIAEGDYVVTRLTGSGTMKGPIFNMQATGKKATWTELHTVRMSNGKVVEHWASVDQAGMMTQLGLLPMPGAKR